ncbi:uncharacterized protein LAJ45_11243 [Morchella importuna]|uniref:uncharacterized protein n=1 Tax=Morchella importuna TaxID=1174673 RepID=UPI001E8EBF0B|nr:uncharacterized protein LAJ45_11243 [Morchella importuna]KAH8144742.1 hypothetical protein LAJ45_11243 [Morchella importuna]
MSAQPIKTPSSASTPSAVPGTTEKGAMLYYEKLRKELREMLQRKRVLDKNLAQYEENIAKCEIAYLEDTQNGNIVKGFDNYIKGTAARRRTNISDADRIFSLSSYSYAAKLQQQEDATPATSTSTPTVAENLPRLSTQSRNKKKRRKGEDESESPSEVETPGHKRVRISFSGQGQA